MHTSEFLNIDLGAKRGHSELSPQFVSLDSADAQATALVFIDLARELRSKPKKTFADQASQCQTSLPELARRLCALILDPWIWIDTKKDSKSFRWHILRRAQALRFRNYKSYSERTQALAADLGLDPELICAELYSDLNENQSLNSPPWFGPKDLINRYNVAQVQGLIAQSIELELKLPPSKDSQTEVFLAKMASPLAEAQILSQSPQIHIKWQNRPLDREFGLGRPFRLGQLVREILVFPSWELKALCWSKAGSLTFSLDQNSGLKPIGRQA